MHLSHADHSTSPPRVEIPRDYNAAHDLLRRNAARPGKVAFIDAASGATLTYAQLEEQAHRFASALRTRGLAPEARVMIAMHDTLEWPVVFLGCILAGVVPVAANTLLTTKDFEFMLRDSRAQALFVSKPLLPTFEPLFGKITTLHHMFVAGDGGASSVAHLVASGQAAQIPYHLNRAMDNGLTRDEASEVLNQLAFYASWPNVFTAMPVFKDVFGKRQG